MSPGRGRRLHVTLAVATAPGMVCPGDFSYLDGPAPLLETSAG